MKVLTRIVTLSVFITVIAGCGTVKSIKEEFLPDKKKIDYREAREGTNLEVPPDLTSSSIDDGLVIPDIAPASGSASISDYNRERQGRNTLRTAAVLPKQDDIRVARDSSSRWLVIKGSAQQVWTTRHHQAFGWLKQDRRRRSPGRTQPQCCQLSEP